jgi:hypothetical protein
VTVPAITVAHSNGSGGLVISAKRIGLALALATLGLLAATAAPASALYYPSGPQANVDQGQLEGWEPCFSDLFGDDTAVLDDILTQCDKDLLLLAGGPTGDPTLTVLAAAPRADVLFDTGESNTPHDANGSGWYFNDNYSWGFAKQGDPILRDSCDVAGTEFEPGPNPGLRLCWHTENGFLDGGYRAGAVSELNNSTDYTRYIYQATCDASVQFGKVRRNRKKGTATLPLTVPVAGTLVGSGKGLKLVQMTLTQAGTVDLPVKPKGAKRRALNAKGKAKVRETISFTASCGASGESVSKIKLRKRLG